jgi:mono/diheme cytochrome c family protein
MTIDWHEWWEKLLNILRHPWHSVVSLFAAVGDLIRWVLRLVWRLALWLWRRVRRLFSISMWQFVKGAVYAVFGLFVLTFVITLLLVLVPETRVPNFQPVDEHIYLSEGWGWTGGQDQPLRQLFYYTPQGAGLKDVRYSWFVNLEVPWGKTRFVDPERMSAYGFLVDKTPTPLNPDRLPVGFTSHYDPTFGENVLDITCAACHTGELTVNKNGKRYGLRIDGGPAMHAFTAMHLGNFAPELLGSLISTYLNPFKFARFAKPVLGPRYPHGWGKLHGDLGTVIGGLLRQGVNDSTRHLYPTDEGPGRIDALGRIGNTVFGDELSPLNYKLSNAPVRYPPVWDIWKFNYVQYNASVRQPMTRNVSESLGVGARAELLDRYGSPIPRDQHFGTSVMMDDLSEIETALWSLEPPKWNQSCMGPIDWDKAKKGRDLFEGSCRHCHGPFPASEQIKEWFAYLKTPRYDGPVLDDWQDFLNRAYGYAGEDRVPGRAVAAPAKETQVGIWLPETLPATPQNEVEKVPLYQTPSQGSVKAPRPPAHIEEAEEEETRDLSTVPPRQWGKPPQVPRPYDLPLWMMHALTVDDIGTDPTAAVNFLEKQIDLSMIGIPPAIAADGMRTLLEHDLNDETDAYAKEILRLSGKPDAFHSIREMTAQERNDLRTQALKIADGTNTLDCSGKNYGDSDLANAEAQFKDLVCSGESRVNNYIASFDMRKLNTGVALRTIVFSARRRFYADRRYSEAERDELNGFGELDVPVPLPQYKARPLAGIWAAGPFLHNGSVPTIYQLLLPAGQRDKKFFVGTRDFDPVNLGLSTRPSGKEGFWLDTSITGNSNVGHEFRKGYIRWKSGSPPQYGVIGPEWTDEERGDIIEYLKVHRDENTLDFSKDPIGYLKQGLDTKDICQ